MGSAARRATRVLVLALLVPACGSKPPSTSALPDASSGDGGAPMPAPAAPALPAPVSIACPTGWASVETNGDAACDPWPGGPVSCADGESHLPGEVGCVRIGPACPADGWPEGLPAGAPIVWVRAGAVGGVGTRAAPFGTIAQAATAASPGAIVALAIGTYQMGAPLPSRATIWGACPAETRLTAPPGDAVTLRVAAGELTVRSLTLEGPGYAISVGPARVTLQDVHVVRAATAAVDVRAGGMLVANGLVVRDTQRDASGMFGHGLQASEGGRIDAERVALERNMGTAAVAVGTGSTIVLRDCAIVGGGLAVHANSGGSLSVEGCVLSENAVPAISAYSAGTLVTLSRSVVRATVAGAVGGGMEVALGAALHLDGVSLLDAPEVGVMVAGTGTMLEAHDLVVARTRRVEATGRPGNGIVVQDGAQALLERVSLADTDGTSIAVRTRASASAMDVAVRGSSFSRGIGAEVGGVLDVARVLVHRVRYGGILAIGEGSSIDAQDVTVRDVDAAPSDTVGIGRAIYAVSGASIHARRAYVEDAREIGVGAALGATLTMEDASIVSTRERGCATTGLCEGFGSGAGVMGFAGGSVELERFVVARSALVGLQVLEGASVDLHHGEVRDNPIGANVQAAGYDLARLMDAVIYRDNAVALDTSMLPVPEPSLVE